MNGRAAGEILGVGRALGSRVVTNADLERSLDTSDEWISSRTGISERRFVGEGETTATLATGALPATAPKSTSGRPVAARVLTRGVSRLHSVSSIPPNRPSSSNPR